VNPAPKTIARDPQKVPRAPSARTRDTADVLGFRVDRLDLEATLARCAAAIETRTYLQHMAINAAKLVTTMRDPRLRAIVAGSGIVSADGQSIVWAARLLRDPLPERVAGVDLMQRLIAFAEERGYLVYILGARPEVLERAISNLRDAHPHLALAGWRDGYFAVGEQAAVAAEIRASGADILFVAISSPLKDYFLGTWGATLGVPLVMGVGGGIDIVAGVKKRAPPAWRRLGLEWLYRMVQEPRRLFPRYAYTNAAFLLLLMREVIRRREPWSRPAGRRAGPAARISGPR
jgi:N-acetylglucosaminyldiphosphoundecaprenol N-acetyl-beta-D-mannosaminyltransferase